MNAARSSHWQGAIASASQRAVMVVLMTAMCMACSGCWSRGASGSLTTRSLGSDPVVLPSKFAFAYYSSASPVETSFCLTDMPAETIMQGAAGTGQIVRIDLLWEPKAGKTPLDDTAINASIRYVIIADGEVGVYGGAGFAYPHGKIGRNRLTVSISGSTLALLESTPGFVDLLGRAELSGRFTAQRDDQMFQQLRLAASQIVTNALGHTRYVMNDGGACGQGTTEASGGQLLIESILTRR